METLGSVSITLKIVMVASKREQRYVKKSVPYPASKTPLILYRSTSRFVLMCGKDGIKKRKVG